MHRLPHYQSLILWILAIVLLSVLSAPGASGETLWQIGTFDASSFEFNHGAPGPPLFGQRFPQGELVYVVGKSTLEDWPAFQPGSANGHAGFEAHPYTIEFNLADIPRGLVTLKVSLLVETPRTPSLGVEINGHRAVFYQHPKANYDGGDRELVVNPIASADTIVAEVNPAYLLKGTNKLVLTAIDDSPERDNFTNGGIFYDAIALEHNPDARFDPSLVHADAAPTVFYVRQGGGLAELVDVTVRSNSPLAGGQVTLKLGSQAFTRKLAPRDFGEDRAEFAVADFPRNSSAEITATTGGKAERFPLTLSPAKKWLLYVVPHEHLDVGYSDFQSKVSEIQSRAIDEAMEMIKAHPEFRYSPDGNWCAEQFMNGRTPADRAHFLEVVKERKIFVPAQEASLLTGFASLEVLFRSLYGGFAFNRQHGGAFDYANITDVPSYSWSYASILADAGLKYFIAASDNDNGPILLHSRLNEKSPFWWQGPDGKRILMWYARSYFQTASLFGLPPFMPAGRDSLPIFLQQYSRPDYKSDAVLIYGTQVENTDLYPQVAGLAAEWNRQYAYPRMQFSGFAEAMQHIAAQLGDSIPIVRGDGGPFWEFGNASDARYVAMERANEQRALSAEKISTVSTLTDPVVLPDQPKLNRMWRDMVLMDEHTWTADRSVSDPDTDESTVQTAVKRHFADDARVDIDYFVRRHLADIAGSIDGGAGTLVVFNTLNWQRSSLVECDLRKGSKLVDLTTRKDVLYEVLPSRDERYQRIRFLAEDVPPVGYKCYERVAAASAPPKAPRSPGAVMENAYYRITLDAASGAVRSIIDKQMHQELVSASSPYRFDQYLYVTGGDKFPNRLQEFSSATPVPALDIDTANAGRIVSITQEPFGSIAKLESSALNTPDISTEIILFNGEKKILFANHVRKSAYYRKEGVYFAFPFNMSRPHIRYDIQNGFVDPVHDQMPGAGKEWYSLQHWVEAFKGNVSVGVLPLDAPLFTLGDIVRGKWPTDLYLWRGDIFSYVMNNYYFTNWPAAQGGDFTFRYVVTSGPDMSPDSLSRMAREESTPLETDEITSQDKAVPRPEPLPADQSSFLQADRSNVVLVTWKLAEDGDGMVLRFLEIAGEDGAVNVRIPLFDVASAWYCTAMEENRGALPVSPHGFTFDMKPFEIVTVRVKGTPKF